MTICYFTATGNSLYVARRIGGSDAVLLSVPELMKSKRFDISDESVGIVCPVYAGNMPKMVYHFLEKAKFNTEYFFFIYTFGRYETVAQPHAVLAVEKSGLRLNYLNSIRMVDNYLPGFEMQEQIDSAGKKEIEKHIDVICRDISERKKSVISVNVGTKLKMSALDRMVKQIMSDNAAQEYIVNDNCIKCGICAKVCPADNISVTDKVIFSNHCEVCYACLHNCPQNAIHLKNEKSSVRFRNEHVTLKDIIESNN